LEAVWQSAAAYLTGATFFTLLGPRLAYALLSVTFTGIGFIQASRLLTRWFVRHRGTAIGFTMIGISADGFVMSPVVGMLNAYFSWRVSYVFLGPLVWILAIPMTCLR
jgi:hypothetical protein